ncbi:MAG: glycosyltransferase family 9 protein, partial [Verrucomicrobiota bacterium]
MTPAEIDFGHCSRLLIVKPSSLGDIVHTLPLLRLLRKENPNAEIRWLVNRIWAPLLEGHPDLDGIIEFPRERIRGWKAFSEWKAWEASLQWVPDVAIDVQGLLRSAWMARATGASRIIGYGDAREGANHWHHEVIPVGRQKSPHAVDRYLTLFGEREVLPEEIEFPLPEGKAPSLDLPDRFLVLHPFSRGKGKSMTATQVERLVVELDYPVVVVGRADEEGLRLPPSSVNALNQTSLAELIWMLKKAQWTISVDSGPMHLAAAASPRVLSLHTWSDPRKVGPYPPEAWVWQDGNLFQRRDAPDRPAQKRGEG